MEKYLISEQKLIDIADAIREKTETSEPIVVSQMDEAIRAIQVGVDTSDATAAAENIDEGFTAYVNEQKITGTSTKVQLPELTNPAGAGQILESYEAINRNGVKFSGSMVNREAVSQALNAGGSYTIPAGYHNGQGKVTANSLASQTSANATAADIAKGKTAWVNGSKVTGIGTSVKMGTTSLATWDYSYLTIPDLINATNFILVPENVDQINSANPSRITPTMISRINGGNTYVRYGEHSILVYTTTFDPSTGTINLGTSFAFTQGTYRYIAW